MFPFYFAVIKTNGCKEIQVVGCLKLYFRFKACNSGSVKIVDPQNSRRNWNKCILLLVSEVDIIESIIEDNTIVQEACLQSEFIIIGEFRFIHFTELYCGF